MFDACTGRRPPSVPPTRPTVDDLDELLPLSSRTFFVLLTLHRAPLHGYGIRKAVLERSEGRVELDPGGLYRLVSRLEDRGWLERSDPPAGQDDVDPRRKYYSLTADGRVVLAAEARRVRELAASLDPVELAGEGSAS